MLSIAVEVIILRDRLVNSGGCLIWKVCLNKPIAKQTLSDQISRLPNLGCLQLE
jgi:hypothetical protein